MRVLGIDPGYERLGIAVVEKKDGKESLIFSSCFKTPSSDLFENRLLAISKEIRRVVKKYSPDNLSIETLIFNTNQKTAMRVSEARGVVINEAVSFGLKIFEYSPLQIKMALTGYGRAEKSQIMFMVNKLLLLNTSKKIDDEYDAIAVALTLTASIRS